MASPPGGSIPALPPGLDLSSLLSVEFMRQSGAYALAAAFAGFTWDTLLCFPSEYKYFWKGKFTPGSFLYFMNRYFVVINLILGVLGVFVGPSPKTHLAGTGSFLQTTFAEAVLLRRALTILGNKSTFKYILYGGYFTSIIVAVTVTQFSVKSMTMATKSLFGTPMCAVITAERGAAYEVGFSFIPTTAFNILLAVVSFWAFTKEINDSPLQRSVGVRLVSAMRWQSIAHFALMIALGLLNSLMAHFASIHMYTIIPLSLTLTAVVSSRMLIFMQDEAHRAKFDTIELEITSSVLRDRFGFGGSTQGESSQTVGAIHDDEVVA